MPNKKLPKLSHAILKGIEKYPVQCTGVFIVAGETEACAVGGALGAYNLWPSHLATSPWGTAIELFQEAYGLSIWDCNDGLSPDGEGEPMPRDVIAGMLKAIGE